MPAAFNRALRDAVEAESAGVAGRELTRAAEALSQRYREGGVRADRGPRLSDLERLAYATVRLPATAAAIDAVLAALADRTGDAPETVLDLGAGPATALWPLLARWPGIRRVTLVDRDPDMLHLGLRLWRRAWPAGAGPEVLSRTGDLAAADVPPADLVIASYAIGELGQDALDRAVDRALRWHAATSSSSSRGRRRGSRASAPRAIGSSPAARRSSPRARTAAPVR